MANCETSNKIAIDFLKDKKTIDILNSLNEREAYDFVMWSITQNAVYKTKIVDNVMKYSPQSSIDILKAIDEFDGTTIWLQAINPVDNSILWIPNVWELIRQRAIQDFAIARSMKLDEFTDVNLALKNWSVWRTEWSKLVNDKATIEKFEKLNVPWKDLWLNDYIIAGRILSKMDRVDTVESISKFIDAKRDYVDVSPIIEKEEFVKTAWSKKEIEWEIKSLSSEIKKLEKELPTDRTKEWYKFSDAKWEKWEVVMSSEQQAVYNRYDSLQKKISNAKKVDKDRVRVEWINDVYAWNDSLYNSDKAFYDSVQAVKKEAKGKDVDLTDKVDVNKNRALLEQKQLEVKKMLDNKEKLIEQRNTLKYDEYLKSKEPWIYNAVKWLKTIDDAKAFVFANIWEYKWNKELIEFTQAKIAGLQWQWDFGITQTLLNIDRLWKWRSVFTVNTEVARNRLLAIGYNIDANKFEGKLTAFLKTWKPIKNIPADSVYRAIWIDALVNSNISYKAIKGTVDDVLIKDFIKKAINENWADTIKDTNFSKVFKKYRRMNVKDSSFVWDHFFNSITGIDPKGKTFIWVKKEVWSDETKALSEYASQRFKKNSVLVTSSIKEVDNIEDAKKLMDKDPNVILVVENWAGRYDLPNEYAWRIALPRIGKKDTTFYIDKWRVYAWTQNPAIKKERAGIIKSVWGWFSDKSDSKAIDALLETMNDSDRQYIETLSKREQKRVLNAITQSNLIWTLVRPIDFNNIRYNVSITPIEDIQDFIKKYIADDISYNANITEDQIRDAYVRRRYVDQSTTAFRRSVEWTNSLSETNRHAIAWNIRKQIEDWGNQVPVAAMRDFVKNGDVDALQWAINKKNWATVEINFDVQADDWFVMPQWTSLGREFIPSDWRAPTTWFGVDKNWILARLDSIIETAKIRYEEVISQGNDHFKLMEVKNQYQLDLQAFTDETLWLAARIDWFDPTYDAIKVNTIGDIGLFDRYALDMRNRVENFIDTFESSPTFAKNWYEIRGWNKWTIDEEINQLIQEWAVVGRWKNAVDVSSLPLNKKVELVEQIKAIEDVYRKRVWDRVYAYSVANPWMAEFFNNYALVDVEWVGLLPKIALDTNTTTLTTSADLIKKNEILQEISKNMENLTVDKMNEILTKVAPWFEDNYRDLFMPYTQIFDLPNVKFTDYKIDKAVLKEIWDVVVNTPTWPMKVSDMVKADPAWDLPSFLIWRKAVRNSATYIDGVDVYDPRVVQQVKTAIDDDNYLKMSTSLPFVRTRAIVQQAKEISWISELQNGLDKHVSNIRSFIDELKETWNFVEAIDSLNKYLSMSDIEFANAQKSMSTKEVTVYSLAQRQRSLNRELTKQWLPNVDMANSLKLAENKWKDSAAALVWLYNNISRFNMFDLVPWMRNITYNDFLDTFKIQKKTSWEWNIDVNQFEKIRSSLSAPTWWAWTNFLQRTRWLQKYPSFAWWLTNVYQILAQSAQYETRIRAIKKMLWVDSLDEAWRVMKELWIDQDVVATPFQLWQQWKLKEFVQALWMNWNNLADSFYADKLSKLYFLEWIKYFWLNSPSDLKYILDNSSLEFRTQLIEKLDWFMTNALRQDSGIFRAWLDEVATVWWGRFADKAVTWINKFFTVMSDVTWFRGGRWNQKFISAFQNINKFINSVPLMYTASGRAKLAEAIANDSDYQKFIYTKINTAYLAAKYWRILENEDDTEDSIDDIWRTFKLLDIDSAWVGSSWYFRVPNNIRSATEKAWYLSPWFVVDAVLKSSFSWLNPAVFTNTVKDINDGKDPVSAIFENMIEAWSRSLAFTLWEWQDNLNQAYMQPPTAEQILFLHQPKTVQNELTNKLYTLGVLARYEEAVKNISSEDEKWWVNNFIKFLLGRTKLWGWIINIDFLTRAQTSQLEFNTYIENHPVLNKAREWILDISTLPTLQKEKILKWVSDNMFWTYLWWYDLSDSWVDWWALKEMKSFLGWIKKGDDWSIEYWYIVKNGAFDDFLKSVPVEKIEEYVNRLEATKTKNQRRNEEVKILNENISNPYAWTLITYATANNEYQTLSADAKAWLKKINKATWKADDIQFSADALKQQIANKYLQQIMDSNKSAWMDIAASVFVDDAIRDGVFKDIVKTSKSWDAYLTKQWKQYLMAIQEVTRQWNAWNQDAWSNNFNKVGISVGRLPENMQVSVYDEMWDWVDGSKLDEAEKVDLKLALANRMTNVVKNIDAFRAEFWDVAADTYIRTQLTTQQQAEWYLKNMLEKIDDEVTTWKKAKWKWIWRLPSIDIKKLQNNIKENYQWLQSLKNVQVENIFKTKWAWNKLPDTKEWFSMEWWKIGEAKSRVYFKENKQSTWQKTMTFKRTSPKLIKALSISKK